jgi:hypothetical protein
MEGCPVGAPPSKMSSGPTMALCLASHEAFFCTGWPTWAHSFGRLRTKHFCLGNAKHTYLVTQRWLLWLSRFIPGNVHAWGLLSCKKRMGAGGFNSFRQKQGAQCLPRFRPQEDNTLHPACLILYCWYNLELLQWWRIWDLAEVEEAMRRVPAYVCRGERICVRSDHGPFLSAPPRPYMGDEV